jgi:hypothetical protein
MQSMYYVGLDVHKKTISYCVKDASGRIHLEGTIPATRIDLDRWMKILPQPWMAAMEATVFTGWIYDYLKPHAAVLKVAHPLMLRAIAAAKKKNDRIEHLAQTVAMRFAAVYIGQEQLVTHERNTSDAEIFQLGERR